MHYLIDGYNLIFSLASFSESKGALQTHRQKIIAFLQKQFAKRKISGTLVFDGAHRREEESGLSYPSPLIVAYAPKGQSADEYILESIHITKHRKQITVVTNDQGLIRHARAAGAKTEGTHAFLQWLEKKKGAKKAIEPKETEANLQRLLLIFEKRLKEEEP